MKFLFLLLFLVPLVVPVYADVVLIEVETNPEGNDAGNQWAKLFNSGNESVNLSGWIINSTHGDTKSYRLSGNIGACAEKMINFPGEFLDTENESIILYDDTGKVVDSTSKINDKANNSLTWTSKTPKCTISLIQDQDEGPTRVEPAPVETKPQVVEKAPESSPEIIEESEENNFLDLGISIEQDEEFIEDLNPLLPFLGIGIAVIIAVIIVVLLRNSRKEYDPSEVKNTEKDKEIELIPMSKKFQDMKKDSHFEIDKIQNPKQFIKNKLDMISKLQEHQIGDNEKLEDIKKSLITDSSINLKDSKYLESQYKDLKKSGKKESEDD